jgi:hypothetical protein
MSNPKSDVVDGFFATHGFSFQPGFRSWADRKHDAQSFRSGQESKNARMNQWLSTTRIVADDRGDWLWFTFFPVFDDQK